MEKRCADTLIAHAIAIHAKIAALTLALMAFQVNLTNEGVTEMNAIESAEHLIEEIAKGQQEKKMGTHGKASQNSTSRCVIC